MHAPQSPQNGMHSLLSQTDHRQIVGVPARFTPGVPPSHISRPHTPAGDQGYLYEASSSGSSPPQPQRTQPKRAVYRPPVLVRGAIECCRYPYIWYRRTGQRRGWGRQDCQRAVGGCDATRCEVMWGILRMSLGCVSSLVGMCVPIWLRMPTGSGGGGSGASPWGVHSILPYVGGWI